MDRELSASQNTGLVSGAKKGRISQNFLERPSEAKTSILNTGRLTMPSGIATFADLQKSKGGMFDSTCTHHITNNRIQFSEFSVSNGTIPVGYDATSSSHGFRTIADDSAERFQLSGDATIYLMYTACNVKPHVRFKGAEEELLRHVLLW